MKMIYQEDSKLREILIFKGGTAIRKIYFPEWRLSEDMDFTIMQEIDHSELKQDFEQVFSLKEKMIEKPMRIKVKPEYEDIPEFEVPVYSPNETLVEKLRSILQRGKARDYYDVWRLMNL